MDWLSAILLLYEAALRFIFPRNQLHEIFVYFIKVEYKNMANICY